MGDAPGVGLAVRVAVGVGVKTGVFVGVGVSEGSGVGVSVRVGLRADEVVGVKVGAGVSVWPRGMGTPPCEPITRGRNILRGLSGAAAAWAAYPGALARERVRIIPMRWRKWFFGCMDVGPLCFR